MLIAAAPAPELVFRPPADLDRAVGADDLVALLGERFALQLRHHLAPLVAV